MVMYDIFPVLKHRKFWIDSDFATTGKIFILFPIYTSFTYGNRKIARNNLRYSCHNHVHIVAGSLREQKNKIGSGDAMQEKTVHLLIHPFSPPIPSKNYRTCMENLHYP